MKRVIKVRALTLDDRRKVEMTWGRTPPRSRLPQRAVSVRQSQEESINGRLSGRMGKSRCTSLIWRSICVVIALYYPARMYQAVVYKLSSVHALFISYSRTRPNVFAKE